MAIRWIEDGEPHAAEVYNRPLRDFLLEVEAGYVKNTTMINATNGLTGGGNLMGDITISGSDASNTNKGVVRFATYDEVLANIEQNLAIGVGTFNELPLGLGAGQTWVDVMADRIIGVTYTNTTAKPIMVSISVEDTIRQGQNVEIIIYVGGRAIRNDFLSSKIEYYESARMSSQCIVPAGETYRVHIQHNDTLTDWSELR